MSLESELKTHLGAIENDIKVFERLKETGNSKGENKEFYRGKFEVLHVQRDQLRRILFYYGVINE